MPVLDDALVAEALQSAGIVSRCCREIVAQGRELHVVHAAATPASSGFSSQAAKDLTTMVGYLNQRADAPKAAQATPRSKANAEAGAEEDKASSAKNQRPRREALQPCKTYTELLAGLGRSPSHMSVRSAAFLNHQNAFLRSR